MRRILLTILLLEAGGVAMAQTLGGTAAFTFLNLPNAPQLTGLGGINLTNHTNDISLSFNNPALLRASMHTQVNCVFNSFYGGIKNYHLHMGYRYEKWQTNFSLGVNYINYGTVPETDNAGNILGNFRPVDYVVQLSASRQYMEKWHYGASLKFIYSGYGQFRSSGVALDIGINYHDTSQWLQASIVAKNMGTQLKKYNGSAADDLPFDLQAGISKKLAKAPLQFSLTLHHLHQFNIRYNDSVFNAENGLDQNNGGAFIDKTFRHIVLSTQLFIGDKIEISTGYNYLRRKELNVGNTGNGLNGFSLGIGVLLKKLQLRYARSYYQNNTAFNQFGISFSADQFVGKNKGN